MLKADSLFGKLNKINAISFETIIFKSDRTKFVSKSYIEIGNEENSFYELVFSYYIKINTRYKKLFEINFDKYVNKPRTWLYMPLRLAKSEKDFDKFIEKMTIKKINKKYLNKAGYFRLRHPMQLCGITFLENDVKDWIITFGNTSISFQDVNQILRRANISKIL